MALSKEIPRCPVCRAHFRATQSCSRCGADLGPVMTLIAQSYTLRQKARAACFAKDYARANRLIEEAQTLHATPRGCRLHRLTTALTSGFDCWLDSLCSRVSSTLPSSG